MILILSKERSESSTDKVIDWLISYDAYWERINGEAIYNKDTNFTYNLGNNTGQSISNLFPDKVKAVWFRRWDDLKLLEDLSLDGHMNDFELKGHIKSELITLSSFLFYQFRNSYWLSKFSTANKNKLKVLQVALGLGVRIPATIITNRKSDLISFIGRHNFVITKDIGNSRIYSDEDDNIYSLYTSEVNSSNVDNIPETFVPSQFQEKLDKKHEIRSFYLEGDFYSMAILSQNDEQTAVDFRHYNRKKPNRNVPYKLPSSLEEKLTVLMEQLNLNTGSIDIVYTKKKEYVFLEVNPVGQFGMVSYPCNYFLEEKVARLLIEKDNEEE